MLASLAGLCALWLLGHFYYQLAWPLAHKALLLAAAGAALALIAGFALPHERVRETTSPEPVPALREGRQRWLIGAATLAVLAVVNFSIWQKEALISQGAPVFVELAPVDPRSLMQGDYMRLNFSLPGANGQATRRASHVVARVGPNGVARLLRLHDGGALAPGDILIELVYKHGHPMLVTDARYFTEGEAKRWEAAKYGEFRVQPDGRALLVGLRGANLQPL
ncbi:GDYXXLXY domain-containing protein [Massilia sp. Se16.2.3]|uniref:GDYXXLXY domain-containing protein n=1 Tax=Massilia sp. Se16.2.3 TaxID=2709303 RepID=UPI0015FF6313|nr:GDYXXLXY domain-containing protein [Massilia sp. Se16.2.3]QNA98410.1 GDYXXLXY domain-containing protein [Massilia sp. Se16.2.3]